MKSPIKRFAELAKTETGEKVIESFTKGLLSNKYSRFEETKSIINEKLKQTVDKLVVRLPKELRSHIDVDIIHKRLFISHVLFVKSISFAAKYAESIKLIDISSISDSYICRARVNDTKVNLRFSIEQVTFNCGQVTVDILTPNGIEIEGKKVLNFIARSFISILGGTKLGEAVLSLNLPPTVKWDGVKAKCSFDLPEEKTPDFVKTLSGIMLVSHEARGLWLTFDAVKTFKYIISQIFDYFMGFLSFHRYTE